jgi:small-conductance mechanosensitive channel
MKLDWIVFGIDMIQVIKVVLVLIIAYVSGKLISKSLFKIFQKTPFPEKVENAIVKVSKYAVYTIGVFVIITFLGFDLTSLIVGLGAFSIAISFATTTVIQNFVSGLLVQADKAFQIGDRIVIQGIEGTVVKISVRTTVIETKERHWVYIPNALFMSNPVTRKNQEETKLQEPPASA